MIGLSVQITDDTKKVEKAVEKTAFKNFRHAAASISKDAKASLEKAPQGVASAPGTPPHTHKGTWFKRAVRYDVSDESAVIGPAESVVGQSFAAHEFGEEFHGTDYPERATMGPALERAIPRFAGDWQGQIGT